MLRGLVAIILENVRLLLSLDHINYPVTDETYIVFPSKHLIEVHFPLTLNFLN